MLKKLLLCALISFLLCPNTSHAVWKEFLRTDDQGRTTLRAMWETDEGDFITLTSAQPEDLGAYKDTLGHLSFREGYPQPHEADKKFQAQNIARQAQGNLFHLYGMSFQPRDAAPVPLGFAQFGRTPTMGYKAGPDEAHPTAHHQIIQTWINFGITKQKNPQNGFADDNIERVDNRGLAMVLPYFRPDASTPLMRGALETCYELILELRTRGALLPIEATVPHAVMSLLHVDNPNLVSFIASGFKADPDPGFAWFYPRVVEEGEGVEKIAKLMPNPRVMLSRMLPPPAAAAQ